MRPKILFTKRAIPFILKAFDCYIEDGFIVNHNGELVLSPEGDKLTLDNFGGIIKGKNGECLFIKKGLASAIKIADKEY